MIAKNPSVVSLTSLYSFAHLHTRSGGFVFANTEYLPVALSSHTIGRSGHRMAWLLLDTEVLLFVGHLADRLNSTCLALAHLEIIEWAGHNPQMETTAEDISVIKRLWTRARQ